MSFQKINAIEAALKSPGISTRDLYQAWEQRQPIPEATRAKDNAVVRVDTPFLPWFQNLSLARLFTEGALIKEEFLLVCDAAREALRLLPEANARERIDLIHIRMHYAAALTRLGFTRDARRELEPCIGRRSQPTLEKSLKVDILLQLGDILREEAQFATSAAARIQTAEDALKFYEQALRLDPKRLRALVLTASAALIVSEPGTSRRDRARDMARRILAMTAKPSNKHNVQFETAWARAAAYTILGDTDAAMRCYGELQDIENISTPQLADARFRAGFLAEAIGKPRDFFKNAFPPLKLIVFAGHLPDRPGEPRRFPSDLIEPVRKLLREELEKIQARVGLVSASAGADLLFSEALSARQGSFQLILPWAKEEFRRTSVLPFEPKRRPRIWEPLFEKALQEADTVRHIGQMYEPGSSTVGWQFLMEVTAGIALHTARALRLDVQPMVLWDGQPGRGAGGTQSFYSFWHDQLQQPPIVLKLPQSRKERTEHALLGKHARSETSTTHQEVKSMLFADIVGYSKLTELVIPEFVETFLCRVSQLAASSKYAPRHLNTWGDAVHAVFDFAHDAGCFALELAQMIKEGEKEWLSKGLYWEEPPVGKSPAVKHPLSIRIALHTGPVFIHYNPVVRQLGFTGSHVSYAARIEPVTKPGEVFASEEFASLAELDTEIKRHLRGDRTDADTSGGFVCDYAGTMQLAKGYPGRYRIYRVLPKRVFAIEELAKAAHASYLAEAKARGETPETNSSMRSWDQLPRDLRDANRAQVADIPNKLRFLGYELAPAHGIRARDIKMKDTQIEDMAIREHDRWMDDRISHGWTYSPTRDNARKHHHLLVPWDELSEPEKEKDRDTIKNLPRLIEKAGFRVRKFSQ